MEIGTLVEIDTMQDGKLLAILVGRWYSNRRRDPDLREFVYRFRYLDNGIEVSWGAKMIKAYLRSDVIRILSE